MWKHTGKERPSFAEKPTEGQESVWDYPRPPKLVTCNDHVRIMHGDALIAESSDTLRVLETASPPSYYLPANAIDWSALARISQGSFCEWKGQASYFCLADDATQSAVGWLYANPSQRFAAIDQHASFYPAWLACFVNNERVIPQPGGFYGGWVTSRIAGPYKGNPGTGHW